MKNALVILILLTVFSNTLFAKESSDFNSLLTETEKNWLQQHQIIRLGIDPYWPPYEFIDQEGEYQGISFEVIRLVEQILGREFKLIIKDTWAETLEAAKNKQIDFLSSTTETEDRYQYLNFTEAYFTPQIVIFSRKEDTTISSFKDLKNKTVAIENQYFLHERLTKKHPEINLIPTNTTADALKAVSFGKADAYIGNQGAANWIIEENALTNLKMNLATALGEAPLRFAIRKDWPIFQQILNKALRAISTEQYMSIRRKWLGVGVNRKRSRLLFNHTEQRWLNENRVIRFTGDPNWLPYEGFNKEQRYEGIVNEMLNVISDRTSLKFKRIPSNTWENALQMTADGDVDVLSEVLSNDDFNETHEFTNAYLEKNMAVAMRSDEQDTVISNLYQIKDKKIAVIRRYGYLPLIYEKYPDVQFIEVENVQAALSGVVLREFDAFVGSFALISYQINQMGLQNLKIVGQLPITMELGFLVRKDWPELISILNKAIVSVSPAEKQRMIDIWMQDKYIERIDYRLVWQVITLAVLVLLFVLFWLRTIQIQKNKLRISEERYRDAIDAVSESIWVWNNKTGERHFTPSLFLEFGYKLDDVPDTNDSYIALIHPDDRTRRLKTLAEQREKAKRDGNITSIDYRLRRANGSYAHVRASGRVIERDSKDQSVKTMGTLRDITIEKEAELLLTKEQEEVLRASEERLKEAQEIGQMGHWIWDFRTNKISWSDELFRIYGLEPGSQEATRKLFLKVVHPDDRHFAADVFRGKYTSNYGNDFRVIHPDGSIHTVFATGRLEYDEHGNKIYLHGIAQDITERKLAEQEILQSRQRLRNLANRLEEIREEERKGIAREIHDELGQALTGIKIDLTWLSENIPTLKEAQDKIDTMITNVDTTVDVVRKISSELRPPVLDDLGLEAAIEWITEGFSKRTGIAHELYLDCDDLDMDVDRDTAVFRIYQEALVNIARHSGAKKFIVDMRLKNDELKLSVKDDGIGISDKQIQDDKSIGLIGMQERAAHINASISIEKIEPTGTEVKLSVPLVAKVKNRFRP